MKPLPRLCDDPALSEQLRAELASSWEQAHHYDLQQGLSSLQQSLRGAKPVRVADDAALQGVGQRVGWLKLSSGQIKLALLMAAGAVVVPVTLGVVQRTQDARPALAAPVAVAVAAKAQEQEAAVTAPTDTASSDARREIDQVLTIRALLDRDPDQALQVAEQAQRDFPQGALAEEREALQILARAKRGDPDVARQAAMFLRRHPQSGMRVRLEQLTRR